MTGTSLTGAGNSSIGSYVGRKINLARAGVYNLLGQVANAVDENISTPLQTARAAVLDNVSTVTGVASDVGKNYKLILYVVLFVAIAYAFGPLLRGIGSKS